MWLKFDDSLLVTTHFDPEMRLLADRHYSRRTPGAKQFLYSGRKLVIRNAEGTILFGWLWSKLEMRLDKQLGFNCAIFRNESERKSSEIILECERLAFAKWGPNRVFTYVDPRRIRSQNPGCCFKKAGWKHIGESAIRSVFVSQGSPQWPSLKSGGVSVVNALVPSRTYAPGADGKLDGLFLRLYRLTEVEGGQVVRVPLIKYSRLSLRGKGSRTFTVAEVPKTKSPISGKMPGFIPANFPVHLLNQRFALPGSEAVFLIRVWQVRSKWTGHPGVRPLTTRPR